MNQSTMYYYAEAGAEVKGPLPLPTIRTAQAAGRLSPGVLVSPQATGPWAELAAVLAPAPTPQATPEKPKKIRATDHPAYWIYTLVCLVIPIVGLVLGIVGLSKSDALEKKLGEHALAFSLVLMVLYYWLYMFATAAPK
jgi:hypothetical protein